MRSLRAFLLLLLVALLPLRGAFGVESSCPLASGSPGMLHLGEAALHAHHDAASGHGDHHGHPGAANPCSFCYAGGCMAGPIASLTVPALLAGTAVCSRPERLPASFVSALLERPPRSA